MTVGQESVLRHGKGAAYPHSVNGTIHEHPRFANPIE